MDFIFISMPYSKFESRWFSHVPNINLGILESLLSQQGRTVKSFHFHLEFRGFLERYGKAVYENLIALSNPMGVEFLGLDYLFAALLFENEYRESRPRFQERLEALALSLDTFEALRKVARSFIDLAFSQVEPFLEKTKLVGFSCSHYQLSASLLLASKLKEKRPEIKTVFGGKDCSGVFAAELLRHMEMVDFVGVAECEDTIAGLLEHLEDGSKTPCNVVYRKRAGKVARAPMKPNASIQALPCPRYDVSAFPVSAGDLILPLEFGRGCPWGKCTFCPDQSYHIRCQSKTAEQVWREIEHYQKDSKYLKNFIVLDSDALKEPQLIIELAAYLEGKGYSFHFGEFRADRMDRNVLKALYRFGEWVTPFQVGIETFSESLLRLMNKGVSALKNVEVIKGAVELGGPLQFNLFTCYPKMTWAHMEENIQVMDRIAHLLVRKNIEAYPGEFYLPTDCPIFLNPEQWGLERNDESIFADVFEWFPMPSYSNYPYPYQFENQEEQCEMAAALRKKVEEIKSKDPEENYMCYEMDSKGLRIVVCREGRKSEHRLIDRESEVYLAAMTEIQRSGPVARRLGIPVEEVLQILKRFEKEGLALCSWDDGAYLSLAVGSEAGVS